MFIRTRMLLAVILVLALMPALTFFAAAESPANDAFQRSWERTDYPVAHGHVNRTWMWGPSANTGALEEPYVEAPGGMRTVQYYDKSRKEITNPDGDQSSIWYVTNGLLVVELITGSMQVGDDAFEQYLPASVNAAGDWDDPEGVTYASLAKLLGEPAKPVGDVVRERVDRAGDVTVDEGLAARGVQAGHHDNVTNHTIAEPFWAFMNAHGPVYEHGSIGDAALFENPYFATGRPITEAYWTTVRVAGTPQDVLLQCFERRCLTYTPDNPDGWQVEAGNVGQHYYQWRYERPSAAEILAQRPFIPTVPEYFGISFADPRAELTGHGTNLLDFEGDQDPHKPGIEYVLDISDGGLTHHDGSYASQALTVASTDGAEYQASIPDAAEIEAELRAHLERRFPERVADGLAVFHDPDLIELLPSPVFRAAIASLTGTIGEPAIESYRNGTYSRIDIVDEPGARVIPTGELVPGDFPDGRRWRHADWRMTLSIEYEREHFLTISDLMFHEGMHGTANWEPIAEEWYGRGGGGQFEEATVTVLQKFVRAQQMLTSPDIFESCTSLWCRAGNDSLLWVLNSGRSDDIILTDIYLPGVDTSGSVGGVPNGASLYRGFFTVNEAAPHFPLQEVLQLAAPGVPLPEPFGYNVQALEFIGAEQSVLSAEDLVQVAATLRLTVNLPRPTVPPMPSAAPVHWESNLADIPESLDEGEYHSFRWHHMALDDGSGLPLLHATFESRGGGAHYTRGYNLPEAGLIGARTNVMKTSEGDESLGCVVLHHGLSDFDERATASYLCVDPDRHLVMALQWFAATDTTEYRLNTLGIWSGPNTNLNLDIWNTLEIRTVGNANWFLINGQPLGWSTMLYMAEPVQTTGAGIGIVHSTRNQYRPNVSEYAYSQLELFEVETE